MDWDAHLRETARHLVWMASLPGQLALEQAKHREAELTLNPMYARLPELVRELRASAQPTAAASDSSPPPTAPSPAPSETTAKGTPRGTRTRTDGR